MYPSDSHEMKNYHKMVLTHTRLYILHNLRPSEIIWSSLMAKEVLSADMVEEIKANATNTQQVAALLDLLPARGPGAFDAFCDTLLECDHVHVAEHLKTVEATDQFREEIKRHAGSDMTDNQVDKFVASFKRTTPAMQRFAERKFEVLLEEREDEINTKESEIQKLDGANVKLRLEVDQVNSFLDSFSNVSKTIAEEVQQQVPSKHFLNEEINQLQNLRKQVEKSNGNELASGYYGNMEAIVKYIERHADTVIAASVRTKAQREKSCIRLDLGLDVTLMEKMQNLVSSVSGFIDDLGNYSTVPTDSLRTELQKVHTHAQNMADDLMLVNRKFQAILKQKKKVETEVFSLLHNLKETRRLEREVKEKRSHITDLSKQGQLVRKKARSHRKELEQIQLNLTQKKLQLSEVQKALENQLQSADVRMHLLLRLLPDDSGDAESITDTESLGTSTPCTDDFRSLSGSLPRMKQNGETYTLKSPTGGKPQSTTPRATGITSEATKVVPKPNSDSVKQGEGDKENSKAEVNMRVGQPYRNRLSVPKQRPARPVAMVSKPQLVMKVEGGKVQNGTGSTAGSSNQNGTGTTGVSAQSRAAPTSDTKLKQPQTDKVAVVVEDENTEMDLAQRATKRQHESSPDSASTPSSADSSKPKWPLHHAGQPAAKKSPQEVSADSEASSDADDEEEEVEVKLVTEKEKPKLPTKTMTNGSSSSQQGRYQYVIKSNTGRTSMSNVQGRTSSLSPSKVPMGLSRDEYWQWMRDKQAAQSSPMTIGSLNMPVTPGASSSNMPIAREIPASMPTMVFRQTSQPPATHNRNDDRDANKQRSNLREAFATKRVEPCFKLPTNGR